MKRIGILAGRERSFPNAFIERVNHRDGGVVAEWVKLGGTALGEPNPYSVIVDRISHEVPYYALYLKDAHSQGVYVINDPYRRAAEDKFAANGMAQRLGVAVPKTLVLPNHENIPDITAESLTNLMYPLDWNAVARYIGLPAVMKPALGGGWKSVHVVHSISEMIQAYDESGQLTMMVQEYVQWDRYVRCICVGRDKVLPVAWDPRKPHFERYLGAPEDLEPALRGRIEHDALALCRGLGYDMNTVEFAVRDGVPVAIDFTNSAPDFDISSLGPTFFDWVLEAMTELVLEKAAGAPYAVSPEYGAGPGSGPVPA
jgi:hypothetical protein